MPPLLSRVEFREELTQRLGHEVPVRDPHVLDDQDREDIAVLNLQRATQAAIDLAIAAEELELPATLRESFDRLEASAELSPELAARMRAMVGFRDIAVHDYQAVNRTILKAILDRHLGDLRAFAAYALERAGLVGP